MKKIPRKKIIYSILVIALCALAIEIAFNWGDFMDGYHAARDQATPTHTE